jgi:transcriptional regulator GlxA family with amidase domain
VVLPAGLAHALAGGRDQPLETLPVTFAAEQALTVALQPLWDEIVAGPAVIHCGPGARVEAERLARRVRCEQHRDRTASAVAVRAYLLSLLVLLYRRTLHAPAPAAPVESALSAVAAHMETHYGERLHLEELAERAHLSPRQFVTRFKRAYGETPARHLTRLRIAAAQELLRSAPRTIADIASEVGYESLSHFYRTFLRFTGMSPGRYRQLAVTEAAHPGAEDGTRSRPAD